ncbi:MAG TPA: sensor histidine kinase N-terminal domain-containing protein, partial [Candidatus Acidoferrum sp.]|nr:sensor histidine kinase N-terminal domain-containing protein [Candidatus Acidoferrum sp.]
MPEVTLRRSLAIRFAAGIILLLVIDSAVSYYTASHFANIVYDRWLVDSARSLSKALTVDAERVGFDLPRMALDVFQFDEVDKTYFRISSQRQGFIAGERALPAAQGVGERDLTLADATFLDIPVRLVAVVVNLPAANDIATVEIGETLKKREQLRTDILLALAATQLALLVMALCLSWFSVERGLKPLTDLANHIEARSYHNLTPLPEQGLPKETRILVQKINDLLSRLEQALLIQKRFIADAAHQLRTPLTAILLYAERVQRAQNRDDANVALQGLRTTAERAVRVSQQLLALARAEPEAQASIEFTPLDLASFVRSVGEEWVPRALAEDIDFGLIVPEQAVQVTGNAFMLRELLSNLIDNAFRYSGRGSKVSLTVHATPLPAIVVEDNGPGIPPEERDKVFERFHRVERSGPSGCGLGLSIVQRIASLHNATVAVTAAEQ